MNKEKLLIEIKILLSKMTEDQRLDFKIKLFEGYCDLCCSNEKKYGKCYCSPGYDI